MLQKDNLYVSLVKGYSGVGEQILPLQEADYLDLRGINFYHIKELTFEDDSPRREAFENVISTIGIQGIIFVYLIIGDKDGVSFYSGIAKDTSYDGELELDIDDIADRVLKPSIEGNFRGSKVFKVENKDELVSKVRNMSVFGKVTGVPSVHKDKENFQGIDRLIDIMNGDEFGLMILSKPISKDEISQIEMDIFNLHNVLSPIAKQSIQHTEGETDTRTSSHTQGSSFTEGSSYSEAKGSSKGSSSGWSSGDGEASESGSTNQNKSNTTTTGTSNSKTTNQSDTKGDSQSKNSGKNLSFETTNKFASEWLKYLDEVLIKRLNYGKNRGLFKSCIYLMSNENSGNLTKLGRAIKSIFSGDENNKAPLDFKFLDEKSNEIEAIKNFQIPKVKTNYPARIISSMDLKTQSNWLSTSELSVIATLPKKEVVGLSLREEVEFGLNFKDIKNSSYEKFELGNMIQSGNELENKKVCIDKAWLDKHIFIAGVTGSGKTTTCQSILKSANLPFLVIEPAKTEYRAMLEDSEFSKNLIIFTLGNNKVAPFKMNPFEFFPHESISSRVDMIRANIEASFDMEAAIPQIIETALYECYKDYGWDITSSTNSKFENPFADGVFAFPTLSDLYAKTKSVVDKQGFDERLKRDYIGSINARLQGLLVGAKSYTLNNERGINFVDLLDKNVVLELEDIKNGNEKSLIMGFILININEALKIKHKEYKDKCKQFRHITLIEEAHRLLSKFTPGDSPNKKLGVQSFSDMLAEVRKYGESLVIVDQIPNTLTPEVLKNTNTKIVHRIFAQDDKEAIGNTMALEDEQKNFLSNLETGRAIVSNPDFIRPIQVQIKPQTNTSGSGVDEEIIIKRAREFYKTISKSGVLPSLEFENDPDDKMIKEALRYNFYEFEIKWRDALKKDHIKLIELRKFIKANHVPSNMEYLSQYIIRKFYKNSEFSKEVRECVDLILDKVYNGDDEMVEFENKQPFYMSIN